MNARKSLVSVALLSLLLAVSLSAKPTVNPCSGKINIESAVKDSGIINKILLCRAYPDCEIVFDTLYKRQNTKLFKCRWLRSREAGKYFSANDSVFIGVEKITPTEEETNPLPFIVFIAIFSLVSSIVVGVKKNNNNPFFAFWVLGSFVFVVLGTCSWLF